MSKETGGFAFPSKVSNLSNEKQDIYGYDVPPGDSFIAGGMTLRDYFAAQAMQAIEPPDDYVGKEQTATSYKKWSEKAYRMAEAMLLARGE